MAVIKKPGRIKQTEGWLAALKMEIASLKNKGGEQNNSSFSLVNKSWDFLEMECFVRW